MATGDERARRFSNPVLEGWVNEYKAIYSDWMELVAGDGVVFDEPGAHEEAIAAAKRRLREKGAVFRNGGASVVVNGLSEACVACTGGPGSKTMAHSMRCHRNCYFCFNPNQADYREHLERGCDWRSELDGLRRQGREMTHLALTGGEPLLRPEETLAFFEAAHGLWPEAHLRLYTAGDLLDEGILRGMVERGLSEIRFSVKLDDAPDVRRAVMERIREACSYGIDAMVEMPVIPGTRGEMRDLLTELDDMGAFGANLLEFCYPLNNWHEFERRGFRVKNPPYPVLYDYEYAGSLPISGSELECLELLEFAIDEGLSLGVHYCSLENKHRDQIHRQNHGAGFWDPCYRMDPDDFFWKTAKVFGRDVAVARRFLESTAGLSSSGSLGGFGAAAARPWRYDAEIDGLLIHPRYIPQLLSADLPVTMAVSTNVLEQVEGRVLLRELDLRSVCKG